MNLSANLLTVITFLPTVGALLLSPSPLTFWQELTP